MQQLSILTGVGFELLRPLGHPARTLSNLLDLNLRKVLHYNDGLVICARLLFGTQAGNKKIEIYPINQVTYLLLGPLLLKISKILRPDVKAYRQTFKTKVFLVKTPRCLDTKSNIFGCILCPFHC